MTSEDPETTTTKSQSSRHTPRSYQKELLEHAIQQNTIISAPTGSGKTLIAILLVKHFIQQKIDNDPNKSTDAAKDLRVIFIVPKQPIAAQQANAFTKFLTDVDNTLDFKVETLLGASQRRWKQVMSDTQIIVATPQTVLNNLRDRSFTLNQIDLLIFDECHHAVKGDPMREIMTEHYWPDKLRQRRVPRILGLSASPVAGNSLGETLLRVLRLGNDMNASVKTIFEAHNLEELKSVVAAPEPELHKVPLDEVSKHLHDILCLIRNDLHELVQQCSDNSMNYERKLFALHMQKTHDFMIINENRSCCTALSEIEKYLQEEGIDERVINAYAKHNLSLNDIPLLLNTVPKISQKWMKLLEILQEHSGQGSAIVFVKTKIECEELCKYLASNDVETDFLTSNDSSSDHNCILDKFRNGEIDVLVATNVAEEGLDIAQCSLVVRMSEPASALNMIQSRGRARREDARFIYMDTTEEQLGNIGRTLRQEYLMIEAISLLRRLEQDNKDPYFHSKLEESIDLKHIFQDIVKHAPVKPDPGPLPLGNSINDVHTLLLTTIRRLLKDYPEGQEYGSVLRFRFDYVLPCTPQYIFTGSRTASSKSDAKYNTTEDLCMMLHVRDLLVLPKKHSSNRVQTITPAAKRSSNKSEGYKVHAKDALKVENAISLLNIYCQTQNLGLPIDKYRNDSVGNFVCTITIECRGEEMEGEPARKKADAKKNAAFALMKHILEDEPSFQVSSKSI